jgi:hypothetical protein
MQEVETKNEKIVDFYPYRFSISEIPGPERRIVVTVRGFGGGDFEQHDEGGIQSIFNDIGKWEVTVGTASTVLAELGLVNSNDTHRIFEYPVDKFSFEKEKGLPGSGLRRYYMHMTKEERHKREEMKIQRPTSEEIASQIENVKKWKSLMQLVKLIQSTSSA